MGICKLFSEGLLILFDNFALNKANNLWQLLSVVQNFMFACPFACDFIVWHDRINPKKDCQAFFYRELNVIDLSTLTPLFSKEGLGEILRNAIKIPLNPPLQRGT